jgi:hypothetical protein
MYVHFLTHVYKNSTGVLGVIDDGEAHTKVKKKSDILRRQSTWYCLSWHSADYFVLHGAIVACVITQFLFPE